MNFYIYCLCFFFLIYLYSLYYEHILLILMILEFIMLSILMLLMMKILYFKNFEEILYYLVMVVCESVLGLSLLLLLIRSKGNDNMKYLNLILW